MASVELPPCPECRAIGWHLGTCSRGWHYPQGVTWLNYGGKTMIGDPDTFGRRGDGTLASGVEVTDPVTGGKKGMKPERYGLIPVAPIAELARVYGYGAEKYGDNNWRKGYQWGLSYDALQRHVNAFWAGEEYDEESGLHHLAHAMFHLCTLMTFHQEGLGTDDRV